MPLDPANWGVVGGDDEPPLLLRTLAERNPAHEFIIVGRNSGEKPGDVGLPANVSNPWTELRGEVRRAFAGRDQPADLHGADLRHVIGAYDELVGPLFADLDGLVVWTGQHGTSQTPIPKVGAGWNDVTKPQKAFVLYASYVVRGINRFRAPDPLTREEVWLCPDPRNYLKARDLTWPIRYPVLGQYDFSKNEKHERYGDPRTPAECGFDARVDETGHVWNATHRYAYSGLEICGVLPDYVDATCNFSWDDRDHLGLFINEARAYVKRNRYDALTEYVLPLRPAFVHGKWSDRSRARLLTDWGVDVQPAPAEVYYDKLRSVRTTFTTPSSGSGWATTKPWQAFATGTVCFFHPDYDTQGNVIPTLEQAESDDYCEAHGYDDELRHLARWLRVSDPGDLAKRVRLVNESRETWYWLVVQQRRLYDDACRELRHVHLIERRLGL